jgi:hypothetical protein
MNWPPAKVSRIAGWLHRIASQGSDQAPQEQKGGLRSTLGVGTCEPADAQSDGQ